MRFDFLVRIKKRIFVIFLDVVELVQKQDWFHIFMLLYRYNIKGSALLYEN